MRTLIYSTMISLDGFIEDERKSLEWVTVDEELHRHANEAESEVGGHIYGRKTWEVMAAHWPTADRDPASSPVEVEFALMWQRMPKYVFSRTLTTVEGAELVHGPADEAVRRLKEQQGEALSVGGANFANTLAAAGLIDELWLYVQPVLLGGGTPMVRMATKLRLTETRSFRSGVVYLRYARA